MYFCSKFVGLTKRGNCNTNCGRMGMFKLGRHDGISWIHWISLDQGAPILWPIMDPDFRGVFWHIVWFSRDKNQVEAKHDPCAKAACPFCSIKCQRQVRGGSNVVWINGLANLQFIQLYNRPSVAYTALYQFNYLTYLQTHAKCFKSLFLHISIVMKQLQMLMWSF